MASSLPPSGGSQKLLRYFSSTQPPSDVTHGPSASRPPSHPVSSTSSANLHISALHLSNPKVPKYVVVYAATPTSARITQPCASTQASPVATENHLPPRLSSAQSLRAPSSASPRIASLPSMTSNPASSRLPPMRRASGPLEACRPAPARSRIGRTEPLIDRSDRGTLEWARAVPFRSSAPAFHICIYAVPRRQHERHSSSSDTMSSSFATPSSRSSPSSSSHSLVAYVTVESRRLAAAVRSNSVLELPVTTPTVYDKNGKAMSNKMNPNAVVRISPLVQVHAKVTSPQQTSDKCPGGLLTSSPYLSKLSLSAVSSTGGGPSDESSDLAGSGSGGPTMGSASNEPRKITLGLSADYMERCRSFGRKSAVERTFYTLHVAVGPCESADQQDLGDGSINRRKFSGNSGEADFGGPGRRRSSARTLGKSKERKHRGVKRTNSPLDSPEQENLNMADGPVQSSKPGGDSSAADEVSGANEKSNWTLVYRSSAVSRVNQKSSGGSLDLQFMSNKPLLSIPGATLMDPDGSQSSQSAVEKFRIKMGLAPDRSQLFSLPNASFCAAKSDQFIKLSLFEDLKPEGKQRLIAYTVFTLDQLRGDLGATMPFVVKGKKKVPAKQVGTACLTQVEHCPDPHYFALRARLDELK